MNDSGYKSFSIALSKKPIYGIVSVSMPFVAALLAWTGFVFANAFDNFVFYGTHHPEWSAVIFPIGLLAGFILGWKGISRRERHRWLSILGIVVNAGLILIGILSFIFPPIPWEVDNNLRALISPHALPEHLPQRVSITSDGYCATFRKGSPEYERLVGLLWESRSIMESGSAGDPPPGIDSSHGSITIPYYGISHRFRFCRSKVNHNYLWLYYPHMNRGGYAIIPIVEDGRLLRLLQETSAQQSDHSSSKITH